jgi:putative transposase
MDIPYLVEKGRLSRYFRSRKKLSQANLISHVTQRAAGKDVLFIDEDDYGAMLSFLKSLSTRHRVAVLAFCLMPNHLHLLVRPGDDNLHVFFRDLFGQYAARFNHRYERKGHLFGGPFRQSVVLDEKYLLAASLYIHSNPVRAGLTTDPRDYRFSSCRLYTMADAPKAFVDPEPVISLVARTAEDRVSRYTDLLLQGAGIDAGNVLEDEQSVERFMALVMRSFPSLFTGDPSCGASVSDDSVLQKAKDDRTDFDRVRNHRNAESMKAKKYMAQQLLARGYTKTQIADRLAISRKTVYNLLSEGCE